ncbi:hypothetical protein [Micromonospora sp. NPDC002717]|uniref:hypothetical protein n=1 Tax=Micromonospora sp. NPDC002717 TaxID=3154424 RepID=UPI0033223826
MVVKNACTTRRRPTEPDTPSIDHGHTDTPHQAASELGFGRVICEPDPEPPERGRVVIEVVQAPDGLYACLGVTNAFALLRLHPISDPGQGRRGPGAAPPDHGFQLKSSDVHQPGHVWRRPEHKAALIRSCHIPPSYSV